MANSCLVSGGGGWGRKQGLLSLDPENTLAESEGQSLEAFVNSWNERGTQSSRGTDIGSHTLSGNAVTPGSYVQFFVQPFGHVPKQLSATSPQSAGALTSRHYFGISSDCPDSPCIPAETVAVHCDHFGAASTKGLYIRYGDGIGNGVQEPRAMKINAPNSSFSSLVRKGP